MYIGSEVMQYLQQLHDYIQTQNKKIEKMKQMIEELQQDIKDLKEKQVPSVIKNEYKFDLLKVERLEGTLNIGLNPKGNDSGIGELSINQTMNVPSGEQKNSPLFDRVQKKYTATWSRTPITCWNESKKSADTRSMTTTGLLYWTISKSKLISASAITSISFPPMTWSRNKSTPWCQK